MFEPVMVVVVMMAAEVVMMAAEVVMMAAEVVAVALMISELVEAELIVIAVVASLSNLQNTKMFSTLT